MTKSNQPQEMLEFNELVKGVPYADMASLRPRFLKLMELIGISEDNLKDQKGAIWFYKDEKEFILALFQEMDKPFLKKLLEQTDSYKAMKSLNEEAAEFRRRMLPLADVIKDERLRNDSIKMIEGLSRYQLRAWEEALFETINSIGEQVIAKNLTYEENMQFVMEAKRSLDDWMRRHNLENI